MNDKNNKEYKLGTKLIILLVLIGCMFLALGIYITLIEVFHKEEYVNNPANQRQWVTEQNILRGKFTDRYGTVLAHSEKTNGEQRRIYDYGSLYTHVIGYSSRTYGKTLLEFSCNKYLSGSSSVSNITNNFVDEKQGDTIKLTIDNDLQKVAAKMMNGRNGAVIAIEPKTGDILCMYSNPTFDPHSGYLEDNWLELTSNDKSPFVSRATSGLYAPGSIFKTIILAAAIENGYDDFVTEDNGTIQIGDKTYENQGSKRYGKINLEEAYKYSSNVAFMELGLKLGSDTIRKYAKKFSIGLNGFEFDIPIKNGNFDYKSNLHDGEIAIMSIGQGETLVTPLQMAVMTATIANNGIRVQPKLISKISNVLGITVGGGKYNSSERIIEKSTADIIKKYMVETVNSGTGKVAQIQGFSVGGKTGTAENELSGKEHTWFIGFAPYEDPSIAVAVICEYSGGSGASNSAPVAREIMKCWLNK